MLYVKDNCIGCGLCEQECYFGAMAVQEGRAIPTYERCFKCGHCIAVCPQNCLVLDDYPQEDIIENQPEDFDIPPEKLLNFVKFRRSARHFKNKEVPPELLRKIIEIGRFTQTGGNQQNVSYIVVQKQREEFRRLVIERLAELSPQYKDSEDPTYRRYALLWKMFKTFYKKDPSIDKLFFHAPVLLLTTSPSPTNATLAAANIANMVDATPELGTCFSGFAVMAAQGNAAIRELLQVPTGHEIVNCLMIGYNKHHYRRTVQRKSAEITWL